MPGYFDSTIVLLFAPQQFVLLVVVAVINVVVQVRTSATQVGASKNYGYLFGVPHNKDSSVYAFMLGLPYSEKLPNGCSKTDGSSYGRYCSDNMVVSVTTDSRTLGYQQGLSTISSMTT